MKKNFIISIPWKRLFFVVLPLALFVCCASFLVGVAVVDRVIMPGIVGVNRGVITVPVVASMGSEQAREALFAVGLLSRISEREFNDSLAEGTVIRQNPPPGVEVKRGRRVDLIVSRGSAVGVMPRLEGVSERQARIILRQDGFLLGRVRKTYSETVPLDVVIQSNPPGGARVSREVEVELSVSDGPRPTHAEVPNLIGESLGEARDRIAGRGFVVGRIEYAHHPTLTPGTVVSQSVPPGTKAEIEMAISLVVSMVRQ